MVKTKKKSKTAKKPAKKATKTKQKKDIIKLIIPIAITVIVVVIAVMFALSLTSGNIVAKVNEIKITEKQLNDHYDFMFFLSIIIFFTLPISSPPSDKTFNPWNL